MDFAEVDKVSPSPALSQFDCAPDVEAVDKLCPSPAATPALSQFACAADVETTCLKRGVRGVVSPKYILANSIALARAAPFCIVALNGSRRVASQAALCAPPSFSSPFPSELCSTSSQFGCVSDVDTRTSSLS